MTEEVIDTVRVRVGVTLGEGDTVAVRVAVREGEVVTDKDIVIVLVDETDDETD